jgi:nucleotide-binding universal stress UspA family protein
MMLTATEEPLMYDRIAIPLDGSRTAYAALRVGQRLAYQHQATLQLVVVATEEVTDADSIFDEAQTRLAGTEFTTLVIPHDDPAEALSDFDAGDPATLLCMSTRGRGLLRRTLLGSTAMSVVERSPHGVVLVGPHCDLEVTAVLDPITVCLDGSPEAERILDWAATWSRSTHCSLFLLRVVYPIGAPGRSDPPSLSFRRELTYLADVAERLEGQGLDLRHVTLAHEDPSVAIMEATRNHINGLIAVATTHRRPLNEFLFGSVAADVIAQSRSPILILSQHGPTSPPSARDHI